MKYKDLNNQDKETFRKLFEKMGDPIEDENKVIGFFWKRGDMNRFPEQEPPKPETLKEKLKRISKPNYIRHD